MTYLAFHGVFILPPILVLAWLPRGPFRRLHPRAGRLLGLMAAIALVYTAPWDNYLVWRGVWGYGAERVLGTIGHVPVEEYLFFLLQPLLAGLWLFRLLPVEPAPAGSAVRPAGAATYGAIVLMGCVLLRRVEGTYLGLILVWFGPILALQWAYAGREIWTRRRVWAAGIIVPTLYLWAADAAAIHLGIWRISDAHTLGPALGPLPLEEAVFFLTTNLLVIQGLLLFLHPPQAGRPASAGAPDAVPGGAPARRRAGGAE